MDSLIDYCVMSSEQYFS